MPRLPLPRLAALVSAVINNRKEALQMLQDVGADLEASCASGTTALMHAARTGNVELVEVSLIVDCAWHMLAQVGTCLASQGVRPGVLRPHGPSPTHLCRSQHLRRAGVDTEREMGKEKWTALTHAARHGRIAVAKMLHKLDADLGGRFACMHFGGQRRSAAARGSRQPSGTNWTGTALMWAAAVGDARMVSEFLRKPDRKGHPRNAALRSIMGRPPARVDCPASRSPPPHLSSRPQRSR